MIGDTVSFAGREYFFFFLLLEISSSVAGAELSALAVAADEGRPCPISFTCVGGGRAGSIPGQPRARMPASNAPEASPGAEFPT